MGTTWSVKLSQYPGELVAKKLNTDIEQLLEQINDQMSTYRPDSELSRFNKHQGADWFEVSPGTARVIDEALRISELSDGAFDVTVGPLVNLWRFGPDKKNKAFPTDQEVESARARVGYKKLHVRLAPPGLRKTQPDIYVDLSAIAKGYGVDRIAEYLEGENLNNYLVEIGGEVRARGTKSNAKAWRVGIEAPLVNQRKVQWAVEIGDRAMATSGDYRNYFEHEGKRYSHTIDPRTGRPVDHTLTSVSVVADSCMEADALATMLMVLGPDKAYSFAGSQNLGALLITRKAKGFSEKTTQKFPQLIAARSGPAGSGQIAPPASSMVIFFVALLVFGLAVAGMAIGVIVSNRRLKGTCGGLSSMPGGIGDSACMFCTNPSPECVGPESKDPADLKKIDAASNESVL